MRKMAKLSSFCGCNGHEILLTFAGFGARCSGLKSRKCEIEFKQSVFEVEYGVQRLNVMILLELA